MKLFSSQNDLEHIIRWSIDTQKDVIHSADLYKYNIWGDGGIHSEDIDVVSNIIRSLQEGKPIMEEYRVIHPQDGSIRWVRTHGLPVRDERGILIRMEGMTTDITNQKLSEQSYAALFEQHPDAVFTMGLDGRFTSVNPAFERLLGYSMEEFLHFTMPNVLAFEQHERIERLLENINK